MNFTRLLESDIDPSYIELLGQIGKFGPSQTVDTIKQIYRTIQNDPNLQIWVMRDEQRIVATGTLLVEQKLYRNGQRVGHIEDICVDPAIHGKGLGRQMVNKLVEIAKSNQCYKVILDCASDKEKFYEKCGFEHTNSQMAFYL